MDIHYDGYSQPDATPALHANCPTFTTRKGIWNIIFGFSCFGNTQELSLVVIFLKILSIDKKNVSKVTIYGKNHRFTLAIFSSGIEELENLSSNIF